MQLTIASKKQISLFFCKACLPVFYSLLIVNIMLIRRNHQVSAQVITSIHPNVEAFLPLLTLNQDVQAQPRIVGGDIVNPPNRYPFMVSAVKKLEGYQPSHICGGTLVAPNVVLCAAHCAELVDAVQIGRFDLDKNESYEEFNVIEKKIHPNYDPASQDYDFMVLKLSGSSIYSPVTLDDGKAVLKKGTNLIVMGWGMESDVAEYGSNFLREVEVDFMEDKDCKSLLPGMITKNMICAKRQGADSCQGDSGGPIILADGTDTQVGIVSWGVGCAHPTYPGVYARVSSQYSWIRSYVCLWAPDYCEGNTIPETNPGDQPTGTITTKFDGINGSSGNMFDVKATINIAVVALEIHVISTITETVEVYTKAGTHVGEEQNYSAWTKRGETKVIGRGEGKPTPIPNGSFHPITITKGETVAFYITIRSDHFIYSDGTLVGNVLVSNDHLSIYEGIGNVYAFGSVFSPRSWNGSLQYQILAEESKEIDETLDNIEMILVGVDKLSISDQIIWANITSDFVDQYYNVNGGLARDGSKIINMIAETNFISQDITINAGSDVVNESLRKIQVSNNTVNGLTEVRIEYAQTFRFQTDSSEANLVDVAISPFESTVQRENYVARLKQASFSFDDLVAVQGPYAEESKDDNKLTKIVILAAIIVGALLILGVMFRISGSAKRRR